LANIKNNSLSKDKVLSVLGFIICVLLFIFSCLSKTISFGAKIVGTFGVLTYPLFLILSFICLIKFLGFSYKRNLKATFLLLCFVYCFLAVIHSIRTFSNLDSVASAETFKNYLNYSYENLTLLGSIGCLLCGAISYLLGGVGSIIVFVICGTLFIGFFIDFELYGKYKEKHIKKLKSRKMRDKVASSDNDVLQNGNPNYSFSNDVDRYSSDDIVAEITSDYQENGLNNKNYGANDVVDEITDNRIYNYENVDNSNYYNNSQYGDTGNESYDLKRAYQNNERMFGDDAVTYQDTNQYSDNVYSEPIYPDVYDENEQRRQFLNATYNNDSDSMGSGYSSILSNYQTNNFDNTSSSYNSSSSYSSNNDNSSDYDNQIDSYESFTNHYYGGASYNDTSDYNNDSNYNSTNLYSSPNSYESDSSYNSNNYQSSNSSNSVSSGLSFINEELNNYDNDYSNDNSFNQNNVEQYDYGNLYKNYNDNDPYSLSNSRDNNVSSSTFNVDDQISKILNKDESIDNFESSSNYGIDTKSSNDDIVKYVKEDVENNFSILETDLNNDREDVYSNEKKPSIENIKKDSYEMNVPSFKSEKENTNNDNLKMKIPAKDSQVKQYSGFNLAMSGVKYNPPTVDLLNPVVVDEGNYEEEQSRKAKGLEVALKAFNIPVTVVNIVRGPKITRYELSVPLGVSIKKIPNYELDIKKTLAAKTVNIQAPIPGSEYVGIELENDTFTNVNIRELIESNAFKNNNDILPFVVGKDISGEIIVKSLAKMVHMLIAGQTGSGKSVFIHSIIMSLIYKYSPDDLRLVLMDPKRVEFNIYNGLPHLITPEVVLGTEKSVNALKWCVAEMDRRYDLMSKAGYNHITSYNNSELVKSGQLPRFCYIVIIVDEFAEVIMSNKKETEPCIQRITQLARACGMHLILATQRPSVDVMSGVIKNNVPSRVAFSLASSFDSKTIIGTTGAENLLGQGDMLFSPNGTSVIQRLQAAYCTDEEIKRVIDYDIKNNKANYDESAAAMINETAKSGEYGGIRGGDDMPPQKELDSYFKIALKMFIQKGDASGSYLQRRLQIGYSRAAKIMDQLEDRGYIASANGSKVRKVLMTPEQFKEKFGEDVEINGSIDD